MSDSNAVSRAAAIGRVGVVGTGVIGGGWTARCLSRGLDVVAWDPGSGAEARLRSAVERARPAIARLSIAPQGEWGELTFEADLEKALEGVDFVQESAPEREDLKRDLWARMDAVLGAQVVVASSSSGLLPSRLQEGCRHAERFLIGHPFNPVYLLPLVELVAGEATAAETVDLAEAFYRRLGMQPLRVRKEVPGYLADRLMEALWRETLHLVNDGVATTAEIDQAINLAAGLRWAIWGPCQIFHLAGGEGGMAHMLAQFGPALKLPWAHMEAPELTAELTRRMVEGTEAQAGGKSVAELERLRDDCLIAIMRALRQYDVGAGAVLERDEAARYAARGSARWREGEPVPAPLALFETRVSPEWLDYNGHMTEACYLLVFGDATDAFMRYVGVDEAYRAETGSSFYTLESHIRHLKEVAGGEPLAVTTQVLDADEKRAHLFHAMHRGPGGDLLATGEHMIIHVDQASGRASAAPPEVQAALAASRVAHSDLPRPEGAGRAVTMRRN